MHRKHFIATGIDNGLMATIYNLDRMRDWDEPSYYYDYGEKPEKIDELDIDQDEEEDDTPRFIDNPMEIL